jgi:hypothetical protein
VIELLPVFTIKGHWFIPISVLSREVFAHGSGSESKESRLVLDRLYQGVVRGMILEGSIVVGTANVVSCFVSEICPRRYVDACR